MMDRLLFESIYRETIGSLRRYLASMIGGGTMVDDIAQEAYLRLLRKAPKKLSADQIKKYLFTTATNIVRDQWRKGHLESDWISLEHGDHGASASFEADIVADKIRLTAAMKRLTIINRSLLWLAYAEGYSHREIASMTGIKTKSVKVMLFRARQSFIVAYNKLKSVHVETQL